MSSGDFIDNCRSTQEDHRLKNWTTWLEIWRKLEIKIGNTIDRDPEENLAKNYDHVRKINEEKTMLRYAKIKTYFDRYRGKPDFWAFPVALGKRPCQHEYYAVKTKEEGYIVPSVEIVGYPDEMKYERSVLTDARAFYQRWQNSEYREAQAEKYAGKLERILPHMPIMDELIVVGEKVEENPQGSNTSVVLNLADTATDEPLVTEEEGQLIREFLQKIEVPKAEEPRVEFSINGALFSIEQCLDEYGVRTNHFSLEYDLSEKEMQRTCISFENSGTKTVRFYWRKKKHHRILKELTCDKCDVQGFSFDKSELLILPKESVEFPIFFEAERPGNYVEEWELLCKPRIWDEDYHLIFHFQCNAYYKNLKEKILSLMHWINETAKCQLVRSIIDECTKTLKYSNKDVKSCTVNKINIFETINSIRNRPYVLYDKKMVDDLCEFYQSIRTDEDAEDWNYSLPLLKQRARQNDIASYLQRKRDQSLNSLLPKRDEPPAEAKPGGKKDKKGKKDKSSKGSKGSSKGSKKGKKDVKPPEPVVEVRQKRSVENYPPEVYIFIARDTYKKLIRKFDYPVIINAKRLKYACCVQAMSMHFTRMESLLKQLEDELEIERNVYYPPYVYQLKLLEELPVRQIFEYFEIDYVCNWFLPIKHYSKHDRPKPKRTRDVQTVEELYCTYFNKPLPVKKVKEEETGKKGKKGKSGKEKKEKKEKKGKKEKGGKKGKGGGKETAPKKEVIVEDEIVIFHPYEEEFVYKSEVETISEPLEEIAEELPPEVTERFRYESYLIVYSCLDQAVGAIIDTLTSFDCVAPTQTLDKVMHAQNQNY